MMKSDFWNVRGECENYMLLSGHKNVVTELHWTADGTCVTCIVVFVKFYANAGTRHFSVVIWQFHEAEYWICMLQCIT